MKRIIDIAVAAGLLVMLAPLMVCIAIVVRVRLGRPVFFRQSRTGRYGELFYLKKFRTMTDERDADGKLLSDDERLTGTGRFLRSYSLDELPQLFNVLRGDMSLVGPRPLLPEYLPRYSAYQNRRHDVPPGITGWAQIHGRNAVTWERKFDLDVWYVDHRSLLVDMKILAMTFAAVLRRDGINQRGHATMPEFLG